VKLEFSEDDLRRVAKPIVSQVLTELEAEREKLGDRIGYTEPEAAALLGVRDHVLRDERLNGRIKARKVGKRYIYSRAALIRYLESTQ